MSDCSAKASEQHRTCGACEELYMAPRCNRFGHVMLDEDDEPDDDGMTFADCCPLWTPRTEPTVEERRQQLEGIAVELEMLAHMAILHIRDQGTASTFVNRLVIIRDRLKALGVSLDG